VEEELILMLPIKALFLLWAKCNKSVYIRMDRFTTL
jgi:hypothetical protein